MRPLVVITLIFIFQVASASADTLHRKAKAGQETRVFEAGRVNIVTCKTEDPVNARPHVTTEPAHGVLVLRYEERTFKARGASPCNGRAFMAHVLYYRPFKGFTGTDSFKVERTVWYGRMETLDDTLVEITVQ
jgi:hypothetical protein